MGAENLWSSKPAWISCGIEPYLPLFTERYVTSAVLIVLNCATAADSFADSRLPPPKLETTTPIGPSSVEGRLEVPSSFGIVISISDRSDPETTTAAGDSNPETPAPISVGTYEPCGIFENLNEPSAPTAVSKVENAEAPLNT